MRIKTTVINSLGEYIDYISEIAQREEKKLVQPKVLWFRGQPDVEHMLVPTIFRENVRVGVDAGNYSSLHYAEDIRTQHYIAKNYHFLAKEPSSRVEWLEVMQHHEMKTRVLDWSESSIHSLLFALEPFLDDRRYKEQQRKSCIPCVWVLEPGAMNKEIIDYLKQQELEPGGLVRRLLKELTENDTEREEIIKIVKKMGDPKYHETDGTSHIDYIFNLSVINDEILRDRSRLLYLLKNGDGINPFYYILSRIYSDGYILDKRTLPPLEVVHPYHSERIKAQKGVFTVYPFYREQKSEPLRQFDMNPDAMDNNVIAQKYLHKIVINNAQKVAGQMLANGMNDSWLYPEMPIVSSEIENRKVYN